MPYSALAPNRHQSQQMLITKHISLYSRLTKAFNLGWRTKGKMQEPAPAIGANQRAH